MDQDTKMKNHAANLAREQGGTNLECGGTTQGKIPKQTQSGTPDLTGHSSASSKIGGAPGRDS